MRINFIVLIFLLFISNRSLAILETRLTYGMLASNPDLTKVYTGTASEVPSSSSHTGLGVDAIFTLPILGVGIGARYENLGFSSSKDDLTYKVSSNRMAVILNYRLINTFIFIGPIATYGVTHTNNLKWFTTSSGTRVERDFSPNRSSSYSIGLESGVKLASFILGAEIGYEDFKWNNMINSSITLDTPVDLNMNGTYGKILFGFSI